MPTNLLPMDAVAGVPAEARAPERIESLSDAARVFFRAPSPRLIALKIAVVVLLRLWVGGFSWLDAALVVGVAAWWPVQEWVLHRWVLHVKPRELFGWRFDPLFARRHRAHHRRPWDLGLVFLPVPVLLGAMAVSVTAWLLALPAGPALTGMGVPMPRLQNSR